MMCADCLRAMRVAKTGFSSFHFLLLFPTYHLIVSPTGGTRNTIVLIKGAPNKVALILENTIPQILNLKPYIIYSPYMTPISPVKGTPNFEKP